MKKLTGFLLAGTLLTSHVQAIAFSSPDIIIESKLDYDWSSILVKKFRTMMKNFNLNDPFLAHFPGEMVINEAQISSMLHEDSKELFRTFGDAVGLNILNAHTKVRMSGFSYEVKGFKTNLSAASVASSSVELNLDVSASEVSLNAQKVSLGLVIPGRHNSPVFNVDIINPFIRAEGEELISFFTRLKVNEKAEAFKLQITEASFNRMARNIMDNPEQISFNYERIVIPQVSLRIGNRTVNFSPEKIEKLIRDNHAAIKGILIAQAVSTLQSNTHEAAFKALEQYNINKDYWILTEDITSKFRMEKVSSSSNKDDIQITLNGDFCEVKSFGLLSGGCVQNKKTQTGASRITRQKYQNSLSEIHDLKEREGADLIASVSEDYVNKLLVATYDAGLWEEGLKAGGVELGPNMMAIKLDRTGASGTLILDVIYTASNIERFVTGNRVIRFPLVLELGIRIEIRNEIPVVIIKVKNIDTSDETLINGRPDENIISTVKDVRRFKKKVVNAIRSKVQEMRGLDLIELPYPEYQGLELEKVEFQSDGQGRMNAFFKLENLLDRRQVY